MVGGTGHVSAILRLAARRVAVFESVDVIFGAEKQLVL